MVTNKNVCKIKQCILHLIILSSEFIDTVLVKFIGTFFDTLYVAFIISSDTITGS